MNWRNRERRSRYSRPRSLLKRDVRALGTKRHAVLAPRREQRVSTFTGLLIILSHLNLPCFCGFFKQTAPPLGGLPKSIGSDRYGAKCRSQNLTVGGQRSDPFTFFPDLRCRTTGNEKPRISRTEERRAATFIGLTILFFFHHLNITPRCRLFSGSLCVRTRSTASTATIASGHVVWERSIDAGADCQYVSSN
jgi:hypothetical protein